MEEVKVKRETKEAREPPSFRSKAERELKNLMKRKFSPKNQISLMALVANKKKANQDLTANQVDEKDLEATKIKQ